MTRASPAQARRLASLFSGLVPTINSMPMTPTDRALIERGWVVLNGKTGQLPSGSTFVEYVISAAGLKALEKFLLYSRARRELAERGHIVAPPAALAERDGYQESRKPDAFQRALGDLAKKNGQWGVVLITFGGGRIGARSWGASDQQRDAMAWLAHRLLTEIDDGEHDPLEILPVEGAA